MFLRPGSHWGKSQRFPDLSWTLVATSWRRGEGEDKNREGKEGKGMIRKGREGIGSKMYGLGLPLLRCGCPRHHWQAT